MSIRNRILCGAFVLGAAMVPVGSEARVNIDVEIAPPPPRVEVVPAPRYGYIWAPGYWEWRGHHHVWVNGHYLRERHGYRWEPHRWVERDGRWHFEDGRWVR